MSQHIRKFNKILVANRGEIAIRVLRAISELKIQSVAIYSYEDRYSLHRYKADEAYMIGDREEPLKPYLDIEAIIATAKRKGVDAIHPGYGFLSENVTFARRCAEEGIVFIGPRPEVMDQLGDKVRAKELAKSVDVPMIPDSQIKLLKLADAAAEAERIGYPIMLKAAAGGGGRGMRVVNNEEELAKSFYEARNEAKNAFGDDTVFIEKFIENPKHIEVQLLGDSHGEVIHLYERDCSVQRRFQKVVEMAPSTLPQETRDQLYEYALRIGKKVSYNNAGTVEFLVDKHGAVYFIEVNPRIQVEHTITEEITGVDIVRSQILIAAGARLSDPQIYLKSQEDVPCNGFAIQCRITTEDPKQNFKPDYGRIIAYRNGGGFGIRLDEGSCYPGVRISPFFDSMLVKVSAWGRTLKGSTQRMHRALREFRIRGVKTNISFLLNVMSHPTFIAGDATVGFISNHPEILQVSPGLDRGTKALKFLGNVLVNGNPNVKNYDPERTFRSPIIPPFDRAEPYPEGYRDKLKSMGRDKFVEHIRQENRILYTDTTFRDAHQSLLATRMRTMDMFLAAESFAKNHPEVFSMEVWGGATFDVCLRFLKEDPWRRLEIFRQKMPNMLLQMLLRGSNAVGYKAYPDNLVISFIEQAAETGIDIFRIFDSLNWLEAMKVSIKTVRERTDSLAEACICYTGDITDPTRTKYNLQYYVDLAKQLEDEGAHILAIKDMAGLLKPMAAQELVGALKDAVHLPIHLHTHDTSSNQATSYLKAVEAGVDIVDLAIGSMSGLTSQPNFNSFAAMMKGHEREMPMDLDRLNQFSNYWEVVREHYYPFESELRAGTAEVYQHEIPGGQYSNLLPQARSLGLEEQFETIKENYAAVNQMFGDIVKVTPSSKVVGDMALFMTSNNLTANDVLDQGETISFPDSVKSFFRGDLGQPYGGFPERLQRMVLKDEIPYTDRPNAHLAPIDTEREFQEFRQAYPDSRMDFQDFISSKLYPNVWPAYYEHLQTYDDVSKIPTEQFFFPMKPNEEILVKIDPGKKLLIQYLYMLEPNEEGMRTVFFRLNGVTRSVEIRDEQIAVEVVQNQKATADNQIGAPLQGKLTKIFVEPGETVQKNQPLFVIEAMKMESTITSNVAGVVRNVPLTGGTMVEQGDLVVEME
ncbi:pyruvate carboxylase [Pontibacter sp. G13]|uniref:pyruvate carboxylase n=1 Tax=Pontibacter sp. G13 TaxID=3074898 RepID=UPI00288A9489|nr:pyruvate carboxylase [Pontibacter sp. G13]WNJ19569.1 pyruvate carboxylase [Pontibacter sp. G13]